MKNAEKRTSRRASQRSAQRTSLGAYGEAFAARHLTGQGMVLLDKNWRCDLGEIDLVLRDGRILIICEVKTRSSLAFGSPLEGVTEQKAARLRRLAARWLAEHAVTPSEVRVDVVAVLVPRSGGPQVEHLTGVC